ncbi:MAG: DedA family protein [Acidobacteriota bacterium]
MIETTLGFLADNPLLVIAVVFTSAMLEYVFPPFWGDTFMLLGCFLAGLDKVDPIAVLLAAILGSCLGACGAYGLGRRHGSTFLRLLCRGPRAERMLARAERWHADHGRRVLMLNRFLPGLRAFFLPLAGMGRMPLRQVIVWSSLSNVLYCGLLLGLGLAVGAGAAVGPGVADFSALEGHFRVAMRTAAIVAVVLLGALTAWHYIRRRRCSPAS